MEKIKQELTFVGQRKKVDWFNSRLADNEWFRKLVEQIKQRRPQTSWRNIFYSLFPISEYLKEKYEDGADILASFNNWQRFIKNNQAEFVSLVAKHGTQGNIPQRAAIMIDYLSRQMLIKKDNLIIELGCAQGLIGQVFKNYNYFLTKPNKEKYFWLKREPQLPPLGTRFDYIGCELLPPPMELVPFFVQDRDKREKLKAFIQAIEKGSLIFKQSLDDFLATTYLNPQRSTIIITSFVLYQFDQPEKIYRLLLQKIRGNIHWLDLSRNSKLSCLFETGNSKLKKNWIYLSHNGKPVAEIIDGSDDCPNWRYL